MTKKIIVSLLLAIVSVSGFAQKVKTVEAEYTYYAPENVSLSEARRFALNQASLKAIGNGLRIVTSRNTLKATKKAH